VRSRCTGVVVYLTGFAGTKVCCLHERSIDARNVRSMEIILTYIRFLRSIAIARNANAGLTIGVTRVGVTRGGN